MKVFRTLVALGCGIVLFAALGCSNGGGTSESRQCTDVGCLSYYELKFGADDGTSPWGYTVHVKKSPRYTECEVNPFSDGLGGAPANPSFSATCDGDIPVTILGTERFEGLRVEEAIEGMQITVMLGGRVQAYLGFPAPEWVINQPNGPECTPTCKTFSATGSLEWD